MSISQLEYDKSTHFYAEIMNAFKMDFSFYEDLIETLKPKSILEIGCGMGRLFPIFMQEAEEITGIDLSDEMISKARKYYASQKNVKVDFFQADMCSFQLNKKYDLVVFALSVLKHLKTDVERFRALENAKAHLSDDGFIVLDHTPFLYTSKSTNWIDAKNSLVATWLSDPSILDGYQWKKDVQGNLDILQWRYNDSGETEFETKFTTYRYDIDTLLKHFNQLDLNHERILTEWGCNGLTNKGKRFIGLVSHPNKDIPDIPVQEIRARVLKRNERLCSDNELYQDLF